MVSRSEIDMKQIKEEYKKNHGKTLYMDILVSKRLCNDDFKSIPETVSHVFVAFFTFRMTLKETMRRFFLLSVEMTAKNDEGSYDWRSNCVNLFTFNAEDTVTRLCGHHWITWRSHTLCRRFLVFLSAAWTDANVTALACSVMQTKWSQSSFERIYAGFMPNMFRNRGLNLMLLARLANKNFLWRLISGVMDCFSRLMLTWKLTGLKRWLFNLITS